jgi:hypothetical protein
MSGGYAGGRYYARELASEQTLENLKKFADKIERAHGLLLSKGSCRCAGKRGVSKWVYPGSW